MNNSRITGMVLMVVAAAQVIAFGFGAMKRSYAAIALPIAAGLAGLSALAFWIGWTMATADSGFEEPEFDEEFAPAAEQLST